MNASRIAGIARAALVATVLTATNAVGVAAQEKPMPRLIPLHHAQAEEIGRAVKEVYQRTDADISIGLQPQTNSLIVVARDPLFLAVKQFVEALDSAATETEPSSPSVLRGADPELVRRKLAVLMRPATEKESSPKSDGIAVFPHGPATDGVAAFLRCHANRYNAGDPIPLSYGLILVGRGLKGRVDVQNPDLQQSGERYGGLVKRVWQPLPAVDPLNESWFEVTEPNGDKLEYHGLFVDGVARKPSADSTVVLQHGCFIGRTTQPELDLTRGFDLRKPGKYKVRWIFDEKGQEDVWGGKLISNEVVIEIQ